MEKLHRHVIPGSRYKWLLFCTYWKSCTMFLCTFVWTENDLAIRFVWHKEEFRCIGGVVWRMGCGVRFLSVLWGRHTSPQSIIVIWNGDLTCCVGGEDALCEVLVEGFDKWDVRGEVFKEVNKTGCGVWQGSMVKDYGKVFCWVWMARHWRRCHLGP